MSAFTFTRADNQCHYRMRSNAYLGEYCRGKAKKQGLCLNCYISLSNQSKESGKSIDEILSQQNVEIERKLESQIAEYNEYLVISDKILKAGGEAIEFDVKRHRDDLSAIISISKRRLDILLSK